jgi:hypothetical protein
MTAIPVPLETGSWLATVARALESATGEPLSLTADEVEQLLELARVAAHDSGAKLNAPLVCYLLGRAGAQSGLSVQELSAVIRTASDTGNGAA